MTANTKMKIWTSCKFKSFKLEDLSPKLLLISTGHLFSSDPLVLKLAYLTNLNSQKASLNKSLTIRLSNNL